MRRSKMWFFAVVVIMLMELCPSSAPETSGVSPPQHRHQWAEETWARDLNGHWHVCAAIGCDIVDHTKKSGYGPHRFPANYTLERPASPEKPGLEYRECIICGWRDERAVKYEGSLSGVAFQLPRFHGIMLT